MSEDLHARLEELRRRRAELERRHAELRGRLDSAANEYVRLGGAVEEIQRQLGQQATNDERGPGGGPRDGGEE